MNIHDEPGSEVLNERDSSLSAAILRISTSLDVETVLSEAVESARTLTGARYGCISTIDEMGKPQDFVSSGLTEDENQQLMGWSDGVRFFEHFRDLPGPLRLADFSAYVQSLGYTWDLLNLKTFQGVPLHIRGVHVGSFYLGNKENGQEFSDEDEEIMLLFASQAAAAIANARTHRDEQRARANLDTLVETSPVGVLVFDVKTGRPLLLNREARRIVETLCTPGHPAEQLFEVLTCRFADGHEIRLDQTPLQEVLSNAQITSNEEIILSTPDGRSVTSLVNATPNHSEDGEVESVVVTIQDLAPLMELDRMRAEFLSMVSHELRTPLAAIKGSTATVLGDSRSLSSVETQQFFRIIDEQANHMSGLIGDLLDAGRLDTGTLSVAPEPLEVGAVVEEARTTFLSTSTQHTVLINLPPYLPQMMADRGRIVQVLSNLLSNAAQHSPKSSKIRIEAAHEGVYISISVSDEGRGLSPDQLRNLFRKYSNVAIKDQALESSGSGLGLAICKGLVEAHGGRIGAESAGLGQGMRVTFTIPIADEAIATAPGAIHAPAELGEDGERARIAVVDDDPQTLRYVRDVLIDAGYAPLVLSDYRELLRILETDKPALVLLDMILPGTDGIELMETMPQLADIPVIFISGYGRDETIAKALDAGADDYIVKPFSPMELTARVRAALRRHFKLAPFVLGDLVIDYDLRQVNVAGREVELTATEYELLHVLSVNAGRVSTYDALMRQVWGGRSHGNPKLVRAFIKKLREKLGDNPSHPTYIYTVRGVGYRMRRPGEA